MDVSSTMVGGRMAMDTTSGSEYATAVARAIIAMRAGLARPHPLAQLARAAMFSPYHFHEIFRELTAVTPARFLAGLRMAEARRLLLHSRLPVARVGAEVGYHSSSTFSVQFGRWSGCSPSQFRRRARAVAEERSSVHRRRARPSARPDTAPGLLMTLPAAPAPGSTIFGCLLGDGRPCPGGGRWTLATGRAAVPLPSPPATGRFEAFVLIVGAGHRLVDALVDDVPGSYLIGRAAVSIQDRRDGVLVRAAPRRPALTDPPIAALTSPPWRAA